MGPSSTGVALVASDNFSARYDIDVARGVFSRPTHLLYGQSYVGRVLVLNAAKGGVATSWMLRELLIRELAPVALVLNYANPIMAQAAAFADIPLMSGFAGDITATLKSGDVVELNPARAELSVTDLQVENN